MLNGIFVVVVLLSVLLAASTGRMQELTDAIISDARKAVELAIGLVGVMALFLGLMRVAQDGGLLRSIARGLRPVMRRLFPSVPEDHPAISAMILNIASNMLGLGNAATPFGIKAMEELNKLNARPGTATDAMVLFLAINTAGLAVLPSGVIGLRASMGSQDAGGIFLTTWFASGCATAVGITAAFLYARLPGFRSSAPGIAPPPTEAPSQPASADEPEPEGDPLRPPRYGRPVVAGFWLLLLGFLVWHVVRSAGSTGGLDLVKEVGSYWVLPALVAGLVLFGWARGVRVYSSLVEGAKEGFQVALRIIPYLVAILAMVGMLRASGGIDLLVRFLGPVTGLLGLPAEALPTALLRPLSGTGAFGVMAGIMEAHGPDSFIGYMVSTIYGSTETTFYVLAVYFGAVGIKRTRHTLPACLTADLAGITAGVLIVNVLFG